MTFDSIGTDTIPAIALSLVLIVVLTVSAGPLTTDAGGPTDLTPSAVGPAGPTASSGSGGPTASDSDPVASNHGSGPADRDLTSADRDSKLSVSGSDRSDPETDVLGWEAGVWHDESIDVDQSDGLDATERDLLVARTMARVERLRGLEFTDDVEVRFLARSTYRETVVPNTTFGAATSQQLWEATFVWGERTDPGRKIRTYLGDAVLGYAAEEGVEGITIVTKDGEHAVSETVLAHELVHVLQDQHYDLSSPRYRRHTWDGELGKDGVVEGEAAYLDYLYGSRCEASWNCTAAPADWSGASVPNVGVYPMLSFQPYSDGAAYVARLVERGGWEAVAAAHDDPPASSEQVVHVTDDAPRRPSVADRSADGWERRDVEVVGEVGLFGMFLQQSRRHPENATIRQSNRRESNGAYDTRNYSAPPSDGWGGDSLVAYGDGTHQGYVWRLVWDSAADARQFTAAYEKLLRSYGAREVGGREAGGTVWRVPEDRNEFADAFYVTRKGSAVTVVNAPTVAALGDVRTPLRESLSEVRATDSDSATGASPDPATTTRRGSATASQTTASGADSTPASGVPGFGVLGGLLALAAAAFLSSRRR